MMDLNQLFQKGQFSGIDQQFARLMVRKVTQDRAVIRLAAALVSRSAAKGHVCLSLDQTIGIEEKAAAGGDGPVHRVAPDEWMAVLQRSPVVGRPGEFRPMVLDGGRLYLHRYWQYEQAVAKGIQQRCSPIKGADNEGALESKMARFFPEGDEGQRQAVKSALAQRLTVISGGPGTGKTYTIAKLISIMQQFHRDGYLRIKLAAPTGKAVMRLQQAIESSLGAAGQDQIAHPMSGVDIQTIHRLLGARSEGAGFKYHAGHLLPVDVVIVDEASMIDLALMAALISAMPAEARLVLIGDKDQLASVEAGAVLGDICSGLVVGKDAASQTGRGASGDHALSKRIVVLKKGYRFATQGGIDDLAAAVNAGDFQRIQALLSGQAGADVVFKKIDTPQDLQKAVEALAEETLRPGFDTLDPPKALARMTRLMILSPLQKGPYGMGAINGYVEQVLVRSGLVHPWQTGEDQWYPGRPVMVTRNDYYHNLFNGDLGVALAEGKGPGAPLGVWFSDGKGGYKQIPPRQLAAHQTAYAMTVHKSQGSEFERVILVLPDRETPLLTRELIYTAVTRARQSVEIWGTRHCLNQAVRQRTQRRSGLRDLLWSTRA